MNTPDHLPEPVGISPRVDCVFKAILGDPARAHLLLEFLHAVIQPRVPFVSVQIRNPIHLPDFIGDDFTVVDVEAIDASGTLFQIEMQTRSEPDLCPRMLYTWADIYEGQLEAGEAYGKLRPVISIWLLDVRVLRESASAHHRFVLHDPKHGVVLTDHLEIHTLELPKWRAKHEDLPAPLRRWTAFFAEAERWAAVPEQYRSSGLEEAMGVLEQFKQNADWKHVYRSRMDALRVRRGQELEMEEALAAREAALAREQAALAEKQAALIREQAALAEKQAALAEVERLKALLQGRA